MSSLPSVVSGLSAALRRAAAQGVLPEVPKTAAAVASASSAFKEQGLQQVLKKPVGLFYDLDAWEANLLACKSAFGDGFVHALALKSNGIVPMLQRAQSMGFGAEGASIGEVSHAQKCGFPTEHIIFDSPIKTATEMALALELGAHINIDNMQELEVLAEVRKSVPNSTSVVGMRINPLAGSGTIAALSVSVPTSKFGIPISRKTEIIEAFREHPWLTAVHVHVGSGGMGLKVLVEGVSKVANLAFDINEALGHEQVKVFDMGGGMPVNYSSEEWHTEKVPSFQAYADALRDVVPRMFPGTPGCPFTHVVTEFGQSLNAKSGWLASRIEYTKDLADNAQIATIHFGADCCPRQAYTKDHNRRLQFFDGETMEPKQGATGKLSVAGPLCFEGDHLAKDIEAPKLERSDVVVLREAGSNTLSLFSRHCLRQVPAVYGYRTNGAAEITEWEVLKPAEDLDGVSRHWGWQAE